MDGIVSGMRKAGRFWCHGLEEKAPRPHSRLSIEYSSGDDAGFLQITLAVPGVGGRTPFSQYKLGEGLGMMGEHKREA
jgi:hypothetical protein